MFLSTKIIGCGNPLAGDDGIGVYVISKLKTLKLPEEITLLEGGTDPLNLLDMLRGTERVILVDAVKGAGEPGQVFFLNLDQIDLDSHTGLSLHQFNLAQVLHLGFTLIPEEMPRELMVIGVEVLETTPYNLELSSPVRDSVPQILRVILEQIKQNHRNPGT
jgi:hydrogenase maturation protease